MNRKRNLVWYWRPSLVLILFVGLSASAAGAQVPGTNQAPEIHPKDIASFDNFGTSLAISGDILLAGAPGTELKAAHNGGAAYLFQRQGKEWKETARLLPEPPQANSGFGCAVAIDGKTAVVGARYEANPGGGRGSGAAYVFTQKGDAWMLQARLAAGDGAPFDLFGSAVAVKGDVLAVGAQAADGPKGERNTGAVYIFQRQGDSWNLQARLAPGDLGPEDHFGQSLALDGNLIAASAPSHDSSGLINSGTVYVYRQSGGNWLVEAVLVAGKPQSDAQFGSVAAMHGETLAVLAPQEYQKDKMPLSAPVYGGDFGVIYIFTTQAGKWQQQDRLIPPSREQYGLRLTGLALANAPDGLRLAASGVGMGGIYRYLNRGQGWNLLADLNADTRMLTNGDVISLSSSQVFLGNRLFDLNNGPNTVGDPISSAGVVFLVDW